MHPNKKRKILFTIAATFCLSQCIIWTTIYLSAITLYSCSAQLSHFTNLLQRDTSRTNNEVNYISTLTYVAYLWNSDCKRTANATRAKYWPKKIPSSERTYKWMFAYSIVTSCWIPASVSLIVGAFYCRSKDAVVTMAIPWLLVTFILTVMDLSAAIIYISDIFQMTSKRDYLQFIGINMKDVSSIEGRNTRGWKYNTTIPAIIFTMIYLRLVFIWLINIYLLVKVFAEVRRMRREKKKESQHISQNFEMSIINTNIQNIQERRPSSHTSDLPNKNTTYVPWTDLVTFKRTVPIQPLKKRRNSDLYLNTTIANEYNQAKLQKLNEEFRRKYFPSDTHLVSIASATVSPDRMRRRHSEEAHTWQEKVKDLNMRRFSEQQHQIKVIAEIFEQRKRDQQNKMVKHIKSKDPASWYEPIWEMETAESDGHYTTIENDLYSPVFDYLGQPASHLQAFKWSLDSSSYRRYGRRIILNYPLSAPALRDNNPLRRIWNEIQQLKYMPKVQTKPPPSPKIDYEL